MATPPIGNIDLSRGQPPYNPNMGEYLIPANRSFTWETSPQEQGLLASAMGRPDLSALMATGQWSPLAGQPYQYQGGRTTIGYGGGGGMGGYPGGGLPPWQTGGYPPWQGGGVIDGPGTGGTVIIDSPGDTNGGKTYGPGGKHDNYHDWYMDRDNPFGHYWALENAARGKNRAIGEQEVASQVDQFAVNPFQGVGRNWTAPVNPYGTTAQGFRTAEQQANIDAFRKDLAAQPMGTSALSGQLGYTGQTGNEFGGMPTPAELAARQASVMPPDFGRNPFAARQAARATPSMGGIGALSIPPQLDRTVRPAASPAVTGVDRGLQQAASRVAAQRQREAVTQSQQREESRGRQEQEKRAVQAQRAAKPKRPSGPKRAVVTKSQAKTRAKEKAKAVQKARQLTIRRAPPPQIAKPKRTVRRPPMKASVKKAASQAAARARNIAAEKKRKGRSGPSGRK